MAEEFGFCGGSYTSQSPNVAANLTMNWYPERIEDLGKTKVALCPSPGTKQFSYTAGVGLQCTALFVFDERLFGYLAGGVTVTGSIFECFSNGTLSVFPGYVAATGVSFSANSASQLLIIDPLTGSASILDLPSNTLFPGVVAGVTQGAFCDGYFLALEANSNKFRISGIEDGLTWNALDVAAVSVFPDKIVSMLVDHREVWFWGAKQTVVYYNSGNPDFPFEPIPGAFIEQGCIAEFSPVRLDNSIFWLGADERGVGVAWRAQGYSPARVSTHAEEYAWSQYPTISDAVSYAFQDQGHSFWRIRFPTANATWQFDAATQMWSQVGFWDESQVPAVFTAHRSQCHAFCFGKHLVGSTAYGSIDEMSIDIFTDSSGTTGKDAAAIRRVRRAPHISEQNKVMVHNYIEVDAEMGLGPIPPLLDGSGNPRAPQFMLRWSKDSHTWSNEQTVGAGQAGEYSARALFRRLGASRDRIYELSVSDPIPWRLVNSYIDVQPGNGA